MYKRRKEHKQTEKVGIRRYYGKYGAYLREHAQFLQEANVEKDAAFLVKALGLNKHQSILDIACGQGRHTHLLAHKGYSVDGVDFSVHLLSLAKKSSNKTLRHQPIFYRADVTKLAFKNMSCLLVFQTWRTSVPLKRCHQSAEISKSAAASWTRIISSPHRLFIENQNPVSPSMHCD